MAITSPEAYSIKMSMTSPERHMDMQGTGKWLGANSGEIKPIRVPTAR